MKITTVDIIGELERLAAGCPWDRTAIWINREPEGTVNFTAYVSDNEKFGFRCVFGHGATPAEAVSDALKECNTRLPEIARDLKIAELQEQIAKLQSVVIGMPPYRPNRELSNGEPAVKVTETVDV